MFNFPCFIINGRIRNLYINLINYALSWCIKHSRNKEWRGANIKYFDKWHEASLRKYVYGLWINHYYGMFFDLHNHVYSTIYIYIYIYLLQFISMFVDEIWRGRPLKTRRSSRKNYVKKTKYNITYKCWRNEACT